MKSGNLLFAILFILLSGPILAQHSVAMQWNEILLQGIRGDFARPTVHARNLYHSSVAMYDAWAAYDKEAKPFFLGNEKQGFVFEFEGVEELDDAESARREAISYAMYRLLRHRFLTSPGAWDLYLATDSLLLELGYDKNLTSIDYSTGSPSSLGNYIAAKIIEFGLQDGSNEQLGYENTYYEPFNDPIAIEQPGNSSISDPNRWQPITLDVFIDQSGNVIPLNTPEFLSPEWGNVVPFVLDPSNSTIFERDEGTYRCYHDPGPPSYMQEGLGIDDPYKWGFALVASWSSHLGKANDRMIDISPGSQGNGPDFPSNFEEYKAYYDFLEGADPSNGHSVNPATGMAYEPNVVPLSDYARVLAEFWADGPDSETPPGHWFTLLNYVNSHPAIVKKFEGKGDLMDDLEWDVKSYLMLGGAMHDCAISAWGIKGYYDYLRPVSAIRYMAEKGQSSMIDGPNYDPHGFPLVEGKIELISEGDPLAGPNNQFLNEIKLFAWKGPDYIDSPSVDIADVGWIRAKEWWPYQRPSFVSPPFAGYISGHSTFSRAAAEVLTAITADPFFPGGMAEFVAPKNEFLVFEDGPSQDITLQWATYRDASDQTSLSRIWGGIHPPIDDIPGRIIGEKIGKESFEFLKEYFYDDSDEDGFFSYEECDDRNPTVFPGATEVCNGIDDDCDGLIDEDLEIRRYYLDADNDGFGNEMMTLDTCLALAPAGWVSDDTDCNDAVSSIYPGASDIVDNFIDEDCSGRDASAFSFILTNSDLQSYVLHYPSGISGRLNIYDPIGRLVIDQEIDLNQNYASFELNMNTNGLYLLLLRDKDQNILHREKIVYMIP